MVVVLLDALGVLAHHHWPLAMSLHWHMAVTPWNSHGQDIALLRYLSYRFLILQFTSHNATDSPHFLRKNHWSSSAREKTPHDDLMIKIRIWLNIKEHLSRGKSSHQTIYPLHTISRMYFTPHIFPPILVTLPPLKIQPSDLFSNYLKRAMKGADKDPKLHFQGFILWPSQNP